MGRKLTVVYLTGMGTGKIEEVKKEYPYGLWTWRWGKKTGTLYVTSVKGDQEDGYTYAMPYRFTIEVTPDDKDKVKDDEDRE